MNTIFKIGELVEANTTSQGMIAGQIYIVRSIITEPTIFGTVYAEYGVESESGELHQIRNGHLLLDHS